MRRSICYCEPSSALAGEIKTWKFIYTPSQNLSKGAKLKFNLGSEGRIIDWEIPDPSSKAEQNAIYAIVGSKVIHPEEIEDPKSFVPEYVFELPVSVKAGQTITIVLGAPKGKEKNKEFGSTAQIYSQRRRPFYLFVDPKGKGKYEDPEVFNIDIKGNILNKIRILAPSFVLKNKRFDVLARFEDEFGNLTSNAPEDTLIELTHEYLRENLKWQLFLPETGFITLPNLYFNEPGIYCLKLKNLNTKEVFYSAPIMCFAEKETQLFWGNLHGESDRVDSTENIENCLRHARDNEGLNFFATSPFEMQEETSPELWKHISNNISEFNEDERFTTFLGFQWYGEPKVEGLRQILFAKENKTIFKKKDPKYNNLKKIYKSFSPKEIISIPSFTMGKGYSFDFNQFNPDFERVVEIYNSWGSSECSSKQGNLFPISSQTKKGVQEDLQGSITEALNQNCRFGFVAGGLDDRGIYEEFYESDQSQYPPGLTAIIAKEQTRESMFDALYNRHCYATTGERIILGLYIIGSQMGSELNTADKPGLLVNRHITGYVAGTTDIAKIELICNGEILKTFEVDGYSFFLEYDDMRSLESFALKPKDKGAPFVYYYLRVLQEDGHMAWSSPIWIDILPPKPRAEKKSSLSLGKKENIMDKFLEEEDEFDSDYDDYDEENEE
ncbi:MAG: DUF3604 domain-containing protein [Chlamydiales bacterium]